MPNRSTVYTTVCCRSSAELLLGISDSALVKGCQDLLQKHNAGSSEPSTAANGLSGHSTLGQIQNRPMERLAALLPASSSSALTVRAQDKCMSYPAVYQPSLHYTGARTISNEVSNIVNKQPSSLDCKPEAVQAPPALTLNPSDSISQVQLSAKPSRQSQSQSILLDAVLDGMPPPTASQASTAGQATAATGNALQQPRRADLTALQSSTQLPSQMMPSSLPCETAEQSQRSAHTASQLQHGNSLMDAMLVDGPSPEDLPARHGQSQAEVNVALTIPKDTKAPVHLAPRNRASTFQSLLDDLLA